MTIANSRAVYLRRQRQALRGKIERRTAAIDRARFELVGLERDLRYIEQEFAEYRPIRRPDR